MGRVGPDPEMVAQRKAQTAQLTREGRSSAEIAALLGVHVRTVVRYRKATGTQRGGPRQPTSREQLELARRLMEDGCSREEAARTIGVSANTLERHFPGMCWTRAQRNEYLSMLKRFRNSGANLEQGYIRARVSNE